MFENISNANLIELVRTGAFALWALVVAIAVRELRQIRSGIVGGKYAQEPKKNGQAIYDRLARLEQKIDADLKLNQRK